MADELGADGGDGGRRRRRRASTHMAAAAMARSAARHPRQQRRRHATCRRRWRRSPRPSSTGCSAVNAKSVYLTARHLVPAMKARRPGVILNIASTAGAEPAAAALLVQRLQGLDDHRDQGDGGRARALRRAGQRPLPGGGRDAAAEVLHGRGHAGDAGEVPGDHPARPLLDAAGHRATPRPSSARTRRRCSPAWRSRSTAAAASDAEPGRDAAGAAQPDHRRAGAAGRQRRATPG